MRKTRMGCLSSTGIIAGLVTLLLIAGITYARGGTMFSPGDLNAQASGEIIGGVKSHAEIKDQCSACHTAAWENATMADRCLACHNKLITNPNDFHSVMLAQAKDEGFTCTKCHTDHRGALAQLTLFEMDRFPHNDAAAFSLQAHQTMADGSPFTCSGCHGETIARFEMDTCLACHRDLDQALMERHIADFGTDCIACHDGLDSYGGTFDHNRLEFSLQGEHQEVSCTNCHQSQHSLVDLRNTPRECFACHEQDDPHNGQLGQQCEACHSPQDWERIVFDHTSTDFPLTGEHQSLDCESCHQENAFESTSSECYACHSADDPHNELLGQDCATCHTSNNWEEINFDHNNSSFPLTGAHLATSCEDCHQDKAFIGTPTECYACHSADDPHEGKLGQDCATCHTSANWKQTTFDHDQSTFPLTGAHIDTSCDACHQDKAFVGTPSRCYTCHVNDDEHNGRYGQECSSCHTTDTWEGASFDHSLAAFRLTGAHVNAACTACHKSGVFKGTPTACVSCHGDPAIHRGLFGTQCASCHTTSAWRPAQFNGKHRFPLNHGKANRNCSTCHPNALTSYTCYNCHEHNRAEIQKKHREEGISNFNNCMRCHPDGRKHEDGGGDDD